MIRSCDSPRYHSGRLQGHQIDLPKGASRDAEGRYLVHLDPLVADAMSCLRRHGESYSDLILRLAAKE